MSECAPPADPGYSPGWANVVPLPRAAQQPVEQFHCRTSAIARTLLRERYAGRFSYRSPRQREIEMMAKALLAYEEAAEVHLLLSTLERMPRQERLAVVAQLETLGGDGGRRAYLIAKSTVLPLDEELELSRALTRLRSPTSNRN